MSENQQTKKKEHWIIGTIKRGTYAGKPFKIKFGRPLKVLCGRTDISGSVIEVHVSLTRNGQVIRLLVAETELLKK